MVPSDDRRSTDVRRRRRERRVVEVSPCVLEPKSVSYCKGTRRCHPEQEGRSGERRLRSGGPRESVRRSDASVKVRAGSSDNGCQKGAAAGAVQEHSVTSTGVRPGRRATGWWLETMPNMLMTHEKGNRRALAAGEMGLESLPRTNGGRSGCLRLLRRIGTGKSTERSG